MAEPYVFTDHAGDRLEIRSMGDVTYLRVVDTSGEVFTIDVPVARRAEVAAALYPAGQAPMVVGQGPGGCRHSHGITVQPSPDTRPGNVPGVMFHGSRSFEIRLTCAEARHLAWHLVLHAQQAENASEPDPAEVERLAAFLDESMDTTPEGLARAFLSRFEVKERAL